jgi:hypothetical protein
MLKLALALMLAFALKRESQRVTVECAGDRTCAGVGDGADNDGALLALALILALALALALALMLALALALALEMALMLALAPIE